MTWINTINTRRCHGNSDPLIPSRAVHGALGHPSPNHHEQLIAPDRRSWLPSNCRPDAAQQSLSDDGMLYGYSETQ